MKAINIMVPIDVENLNPGDIFEDDGVEYIVTDICELPVEFVPSNMSCAAMICINLDTGEHKFFDWGKWVRLLRRGV